MIKFTSTRIPGFVAALAFCGLAGVSEAQNMNWSPAGPIYTAGRARNMLVDYKTNPTGNILYVGSSTSGIFKSTDAGSNWSALNDQATVRNISYLAQAQDGTIYAATGEGFLRSGQKTKSQPGTGLYKLNSLNNLELVASSTVVGTVINRVACNPNLATHIALATNKGIMVTTDGQNFIQAAGIPTTALSGGLDVKFDNNGILYCSVGSELFAVGSQTTVPSRIFKSSDANFTSFTEITPPKGNLIDANYGRIELAIAPTDNNYIYASIANKMTGSGTSASLKALFVSTNGGTAWTLITQGSAQLDPLTNGGTLATGDYAHVVKVHPDDKNVIFVGGYQLYIFTLTNVSAGTGVWKKVGQHFLNTVQNYLHENIHDVQVVKGSGTIPQRVYAITDAGIYRSSDINNQIATFQPFYKGLVTGQFNSVSIERYPITANSTVATQGAAGSTVNPYSGFVGGTAGNGLTYYSGTNTLVTQEISYIGGEFYNAEFSKILPNAVYASSGSGRIYRSTNIRNSDPTMVNVNNYSGVLSKLAPDPVPFGNTGVINGTQFRLWEDYGQVAVAPDSMFFYNDTLRFLASMNSVAELITAKSFTFTAARPNKFAMIDQITVRSGTVQLPATGSSQNLDVPFTTSQRIRMKLSKTYANTNTVTILTGTNMPFIDGPYDTSKPPSVTLNNVSLQDQISVTFSTPPFATATKTSATINYADYYRVFATVYYRYKAGDSVSITDNNISTRAVTYEFIIPQKLEWEYPNLAPYSMTINTLATIPNPTVFLSPAQSGYTVTGNKVEIPAWFIQTNITAIQRGTYTMTGAPVVHTLVAQTNSAAVSPTYILMPDNIQQMTPTFTVAPATATQYTITETDGITVTDTYSSIGSPTYVLNPGNLSQPTPVFVVSPTVSATGGTLASQSFTVQGLSSNTVTGSNTSATYTTAAVRTTSLIGESAVPLSPSNPLVKVPAQVSARLAMIVNNQGNTGNVNAIVVAKNPLSLNDPLNFVRVSQTGVWSDDASGAPTKTTITIPGKPTILEWSNGGTEIYYATDQNKLYRVSHITRVMDLSPNSFNGKFYTDVFRYSSPIGSGTLNPHSPYRTTLIGEFDRPISSISVSSDDTKLAVTFGPGASTATTGVVMYTGNSAKTSNTTNINWQKKDQGFPANINTYSSLMEKSDSKKVFVGTDNGIFYTSDITAGTWANVNNNQLPNVQIFDIKQQKMEPWDAYNSGQIYVATNGRGVWTNSNFFAPYTVAVEEFGEIATVENNLVLYPNPASGVVNVAFTGKSGEKAIVNILDLNGRTVKSVDLGQLNDGEQAHAVQTSELSAGIYIIQVNSDAGIRRVSKLVISK